MIEIAKKVVGFIIGREWYSGDQGDWPNVTDTPNRFINSVVEARELFVNEAEKNESWVYGYDKAYIYPVFYDGIIGDKYTDLSIFTSLKYQAKVSYTYFGVDTEALFNKFYKTYQEAQSGIDEFLKQEALFNKQHDLSFDKDRYDTEINIIL